MSSTSKTVIIQKKIVSTMSVKLFLLYVMLSQNEDYMVLIIFKDDSNNSSVAQIAGKPLTVETLRYK